MAMPDFGPIQLLVLDVDGILTDGMLYVSDEGQASKRFSIVDGAGLVYWQRAGLKAAIISGHSSQATLTRFKSLGLEEVHVGVKDKLETYMSVLDRMGLTPKQTAVMGDDLMDLPLLKRAGFSATVGPAHELCRRVAHYVTEKQPGNGAVREVIELILKAKGLFDAILERYDA